MTIVSQNTFDNPDLVQNIIQNGIKTIVISGPDITNVVKGDWALVIEKIYFRSSITEIPDALFYNSKTIREVVLDKSVKRIQTTAFARSTISKINLENVEYIEDNAFSECANLETISVNYQTSSGVFSMSGLTSIKFLDNAVSVPQRMCMNCYNLKTVKLNPSIIEIESEAFSGCFKLDTIEFNGAPIQAINDGAFIQTYNLKNFVIQSTVEKVGPNAFENSGLTEVTIEDHKEMLNLGEICFNGCSYLKTIKIGKNISINNAESVFSGCYALTEIEFQNDIEMIGTNCFMNCAKLKTVKITGITFLSESCFYRCVSLEYINLSSATFFDDDCFAFCFNLDTDIPEVFTARDNSFKWCSKLKIKDFNGECSGKSTFMYCNSLTEINIINNKVTSESTFAACENLEKVTILSDKIIIGKNCFMGCFKLKKLVYSGEMSAISSNAFYGCPIEGEFVLNLQTFGLISRCVAFAKITSVYINTPQLLDPSSFFYKCQDLKTIRIGSETTSFAGILFEDCQNIENIVIESGNSNFVFENNLLYSNDKKILYFYLPKNTATEYNVPQSVVSISRGCFNNNNYLEKITIDHQCSLGKYMFLECQNLQKFNYNPKIGYLSFYQKMFYNCFNLEKVYSSIPVDAVEEYSFYNCTNLKEINLGTVISIKANSFENCENLEEVDITNCITIGVSAFTKCLNLKKVTFSSNLETISKFSFRFTNLENVEFPKGSKVNVYDGSFCYIDHIHDFRVNSDFFIISESSLCGTRVDNFYFPATLTRFPGEALASLSNRPKVNIDPNNPNFVVQDEIVYEKNTGTFVFNINFGEDGGTIEIPPYVRYMEYGSVVTTSFLDMNTGRIVSRGATTLIVPESVKEIDENIIVLPNNIYHMCFKGRYFVDNSQSSDTANPYIYVTENYKIPYFAKQIPLRIPCGTVEFSSLSFRNVFGLSKTEIFMIIVILLVSFALISFIAYFLYKYKQLCKKKKQEKPNGMKGVPYSDDEPDV